MKKLASGYVDIGEACVEHWAVVEIEIGDYVLPDDGYNDGGVPYGDDEVEDILRQDVCDFLDWHRFYNGPGRSYGEEPAMTWHGNFVFITQRRGLDV